jgi:hypothetical protein
VHDQQRRGQSSSRLPQGQCTSTEPSGPGHGPCRAQTSTRVMNPDGQSAEPGAGSGQSGQLRPAVLPPPPTRRERPHRNPSNVGMSPWGNPSSRAFRRRRHCAECTRSGLGRHTEPRRPCGQHGCLTVLSARTRVPSQPARHASRVPPATGSSTEDLRPLSEAACCGQRRHRRFPATRKEVEW